MTNKEKKMEIIKVIVTVVKDRHKRHLASVADLEAERARERAYRNTHSSQWDDDYGGGFGPQPPNVESYMTKEHNARTEFEKWESIYYYALENFIE